MSRVLSLEKIRLNTLYHHHILDTDPEPVFDDITRLAAEIFDVPIALITLVDEKRQWFKAAVGLSEKQTSRDVSFCAHAIRRPDQPFIVTDARADARFQHNPLVLSSPHVVFYAGIPLIASNGMALGTLCIIDRQPRELIQAKLRVLHLLAGQVTQLLTSRKRERESRLRERSLHIRLEQASDKLAQQRRQLLQTTPATDQVMTGVMQRLQQPISQIQASGFTLVDQHLDRLGTKGREALLAINSAVSRLSALTQDLEQYASIPTRVIDGQPVAIADVIDRATRELWILIDAADAQLTVDAMPTVWGDPQQLEALFYHLVYNALKFRCPHIKPVIRISCEMSAGPTDYAASADGAGAAYYRFTVTDNGYGFGQSQAERIFTLFHQLNHPTGATGSGVGLAICERIVRGHGGFITAEGRAGLGATINVYLPAGSPVSE